MQEVVGRVGGDCSRSLGLYWARVRCGVEVGEDERWEVVDGVGVVERWDD